MSTVTSATQTAVAPESLAELAYCADHLNDLRELLARFGLSVEVVAAGAEIPGSFWGDSEAGLIKDTLYVRLDTPVHSALHEACHYICMDQQRRSALHTDAGGTVLEECGVNYLQILLADHLPSIGRKRLMADMNRWGYSFRLGTAEAWFADDADDARAWLIEAGLIDEAEKVAFCCRQ